MNLQTISSYLAGGLAILLFVSLIIFTNQIDELKKYLPIAELDFSENEFYNIDSAKIYTYGKRVAPDERLQLHIHIINKLDVPLKFLPEVKVSLGGELTRHLQALEYQEVEGQFFKDLTVFDFYLSDEGPNEIEVKVKALFANGTLAKEETAFTTIDVISLGNQYQLEQNKYTSWGIIISATIGVATVVALITSLHFSRKELESFESQNELFKQQNSSIKEQTVALQEQNTTLKEQASLQNRPWVSVAEEFKPEPIGNLFVIHLKNYGKTAATNMITIDWAKDGIMTELELVANGTPEPPISIAPQEILSYSVPIKNLVGKINSDDIHIGFLIKYNYDLVREGTTLLIGYWSAANGRFMYRMKDLK